MSDEEGRGNERFYDEEIAPVLKELADKCLERKLPFLAVCEYAPNAIGRTEAAISPECGIEMSMAAWAARAYGNVDVFCMAVVKHAKKHGSQASVFLHEWLK